MPENIKIPTMEKQVTIFLKVYCKN